MKPLITKIYSAENLTPTVLYRLRMLEAGPRFYAANATTKQLLKFGLIEATGHVHPASQYSEYILTTEGRRSLANSRIDLERQTSVRDR
jgi:hypothetical protein